MQLFSFSRNDVGGLLVWFIIITIITIIIIILEMAVCVLFTV